MLFYIVDSCHILYIECQFLTISVEAICAMMTALDEELPTLQEQRLLTWFNFNPDMDK